PRSIVIHSSGVVLSVLSLPRKTWPNFAALSSILLRENRKGSRLDGTRSAPFAAYSTAFWQYGHVIAPPGLRATIAAYSAVACFESGIISDNKSVMTSWQWGHGLSGQGVAINQVSPSPRGYKAHSSVAMAPQTDQAAWKGPGRGSGWHWRLLSRWRQSR